MIIDYNSTKNLKNFRFFWEGVMGDISGDESFFVSFGGPGSINQEITYSVNEIDGAKIRCVEKYRNPISQSYYRINGLDVVVHTYGLHRAVEVRLPSDPSPDQIKLYNKTKKEAQLACSQEYSVLGIKGENCVSATARVLRALDLNSTDRVILPWNLDTNLRRYYEEHAKGPTEKAFLDAYNQESKKLIFATNYWKSRQNKLTVNAIITHAHIDEKTESALIKLGWVEKKNGKLTATKEAPDDFRKELANFYADHEKVTALKTAYQKNGGRQPELFKIFNGNPDYKTARENLVRQAAENPTGSAAKTLLQSIVLAKDDKLAWAKEILLARIESHEKKLLPTDKMYHEKVNNMRLAKEKLSDATSLKEIETVILSAQESLRASTRLAFFSTENTLVTDSLKFIRMMQTPTNLAELKNYLSEQLHDYRRLIKEEDKRDMVPQLEQAINECRSFDDLTTLLTNSCRLIKESSVFARFTDEYKWMENTLEMVTRCSEFQRSLSKSVTTPNPIPGLNSRTQNDSTPTAAPDLDNSSRKSSGPC